MSTAREDMTPAQALTEAVALLEMVVKKAPHLLELVVVQKALGKAGLQGLKAYFPKAAELFDKFFPEAESNPGANRPSRMQ